MLRIRSSKRESRSSKKKYLSGSSISRSMTIRQLWRICWILMIRSSIKICLTLSNLKVMLKVHWTIAFSLEMKIMNLYLIKRLNKLITRNSCIITQELKTRSHQGITTRNSQLTNNLRNKNWIVLHQMKTLSEKTKWRNLFWNWKIQRV